MAVLVALIRGIVRRETSTLGNFWVNMTRSVLYILLPLSLLLAVALIGQGVPQTLQPYARASLLQPASYEQAVTGEDGKPALDSRGNPRMERVAVPEQSLALGPVASQVAIKQLGTNGGGFYNVNSSHPYENPTPLSNLLEVLSILLIPAALCFTFGAMVGDRRQGRALLAAMVLLFVPALLLCLKAERAGNPALASLTSWSGNAVLQDGNLEGKEVRFGIAHSALWATATTAASNGSVNSMHDSFTPLGGLVPMWMMMLGEVVFGGVGSGLYGMLAFVILAVFIAGLMVGRTPEYLGKKIQASEMKMASIVILIPPLLVLVATALGVGTAAGRAGILNPGAHGFSEVLYAFTSMGNNNGSAFAGLTANAPFYDVLGGAVMWVSRFWLAVPILAIAGSLALKKSVPAGAGTLPTHTPLFIVMLASTVVVVGALTFIPALALGPLIEHLQLAATR
jgi:K+-transporting ATPase ATPase A chain